MSLSPSRNKKNNFWIFLVTFVFIFGPDFDLTPPFNDSLVLVSFLMTLYLVYKTLKKPLINKEIFFLGSYLIIIALYSSVIVGINDFADTFVALRSWRAFLGFLGGWGLCLLYQSYYQKPFHKEVLRDIYIATFCHALIMLLMFFSDGFRDIIQNIIVQEDRGIYRIAGLESSGGDGVSITQGIGLMIGPFFASLYELKGRKLFFYYFSFFVILISAFLPARTGFVLVGFLIPCFFLNRIIVQGKITLNSKRVWGKFKTIIFFVIILSVLLYLSIEIFWERLYGGYMNPLFRLLEPIRRYSEEGEFYASSARRILFEMWLYPEDPVVLVFGNSNMGRTFEYIPSDIGYVRMLFAIGLIGGILAYSWFFFAYFFSKKHNKNIRVASILVFLLTSYTLLAHVKMVYAFSRRGFGVFVLALLCIIISSNIIEQKRH